MFLARLARSALQTKSASVFISIVLVWAMTGLAVNSTDADSQAFSLPDDWLSEVPPESEVPPNVQPDDETLICETVRLYYVREPQALKDLLESIKETLAPDVQIAETGGLGAASILVLAGPYSQVNDLKQVIAAIDVPRPQVSLDLLAFQISGSTADVVAKHAQDAHELVEIVGRLMHGYLYQLEACARASQAANLKTVEQAQNAAQSEGGLPTDILSEQPTFTTKMYVVDVGALLPSQPSVLITPSLRGRHPLSLTEILATILMMPTTDSSGWRESVAKQLGESLDQWLAYLAKRDPVALETWHTLLAAEPTFSANDLASLLERKMLEQEEASPEDELAGLDALLPSRLLDVFDNTQYYEVAQEVIGGFLLDYREQAIDWTALPPDRLSRRAADVDVVLQTAQRALAEHLRGIFLRPMLNRLRAIASASGQSGIASSSTTSIIVTSGTEATVAGSARSYFDLTASEPTEEQPLLGQGEIPLMSAISLAQSLNQEPQAWSSMNEGVELAFTPHVLPGGAAAELQIAVKIAHDDPQVEVEGGGLTAAPLSRVAEHTAKTSVYLSPMDLFSLSSLMLRTTHPRPKQAVPILGQMPLFGQMFRFSRKPLVAHHESVLVIYSTILPTGLDLGALLDFQRVGP